MEDISIISMIFTAALVLGSLFLILMPLLNETSYLQFQPAGQDSASELEVLYTTMNEIEFEYKMDKLSDSDYKKLKKQYEYRISKTMREDGEKGTISIDPSILAEVERDINATMKRNNANKEDGL